MPDDAKTSDGVDPKQLPGCGLAAFALLLFTIFSIGVTGISVSTYSILTAGEHLTPQRLSYGGVVDRRMLEPMREAGLLGPDELPDVYHAENATGSEACAVSTGRLLRIDAEGGHQVPLASITSVGGTDLEVVIHATDTSLVCHFGEGEGGDRFRRMLENR